MKSKLHQCDRHYSRSLLPGQAWSVAPGSESVSFFLPVSTRGPRGFRGCRTFSAKSGRSEANRRASHPGIKQPQHLGLTVAKVYFLFMLHPYRVLAKGGASIQESLVSAQTGGHAVKVSLKVATVPSTHIHPSGRVT